MSMETTVDKTFTLTSLNTELCGKMYTPEDVGYREASKAWNLNAVQRPTSSRVRNEFH